MKNVLSIRPAYGDVEAGYEKLASIGLTNVEIGAPPPEKVDQVMEQLNRYGIKATTLAVGCPIQEDSVFDSLAQAAETAAKMGVTKFFTSAKAGELPLPEVYERLHKIGEIVARHNVTVGMETHPDLCHNGDVALQTLAAVNHPNIGMNFDTANIYYYNENVDSVTEVKKVAKCVSSVHVKDTNGGFHDGKFPVVGEGIVDFASIFKILNDVGFYGPFTFELEGFSPEIGIDGVHQRVVESVEHLKQLGLV